MENLGLKPIKFSESTFRKLGRREKIYLGWEFFMDKFSLGNRTLILNVSQSVCVGGGGMSIPKEICR